jgi:hypothetical protein
MKGIGLLLILISLNNCTFTPVIDTSGRSGTFNDSKAEEITNDLQHCKTLAKENTSTLIESGKYIYNYYLRASVLWLSPKANYNYPKLYRSCLKGRGHSVLN